MSTIQALLMILVSMSAGFLFGTIIVFKILQKRMKALEDELDAKNIQIEKIFNQKFYNDIIN
tara:strand:- start:2091 stop:2276 length:186 start_codon:yes stop_codon:yes gene_type:complete